MTHDSPPFSPRDNFPVNTAASPHGIPLSLLLGPGGDFVGAPCPADWQPNPILRHTKASRLHSCIAAPKSLELVSSTVDFVLGSQVDSIKRVSHFVLVVSMKRERTARSPQPTAHSLLCGWQRWQS